MEITIENPPDTQINGPDSPSTIPHHLSDHDDDLRADLESLRESHLSLQSKSMETEQALTLVRQERDDAVDHSADLTKLVSEISRERDSLKEKIEELEASLKEKEDEFGKKLDEELRKAEEFRNEVEVSRERVKELETEIEKRNDYLSKSLDSFRLAKESLVKIIESIDEEKVEEEERELAIVESKIGEGGEEFRAISEEIVEMNRLASEVEVKVREYKEMRKKEKRELENSVVSLTEENRDINTLLRIALVEKEAVEKSLNKLKGTNEQRRVPILQRVGFGFMMGGGGNEQQPESSAVSSSGGSQKSDSECEEEVVSLASTVEKIMKNLRQEITQLRRSLEESRSDTERLQSLTEKQAQQITENTLYIKELEDRERALIQNVEELLTEIKETEAEVARWREACELEVEAGKNEIGERDQVVAILKQELEKTRAALDMSNSKLKMKEELVSAAMAAQAAAERSLQLADSRAAGLCERIEELTRQLEESESRERSRLKIRHICWPWRIFKVNTANSASKVRDVRRMLPEMQALLHSA
ncbi:hypothetical protein CMV_019725 [Castanea mollissima]|uniref:ATP binding protein n=1 Tax=Castanea mollissima TaxID=60419 RepID=A0A8J4QZU3_9ROSI|nr:hypothetical protein CMV_019725 [Castanea mollissima]